MNPKHVTTPTPTQRKSAFDTVRSIAERITGTPVKSEFGGINTAPFLAAEELGSASFDAPIQDTHMQASFESRNQERPMARRRPIGAAFAAENMANASADSRPHAPPHSADMLGTHDTSAQAFDKDEYGLAIPQYGEDFDANRAEDDVLVLSESDEMQHMPIPDNNPYAAPPAYNPMQHMGISENAGGFDLSEQDDPIEQQQNSEPQPDATATHAPIADDFAGMSLSDLVNRFSAALKNTSAHTPANLAAPAALHQGADMLLADTHDQFAPLHASFPWQDEPSSDEVDTAPSTSLSVGHEAGCDADTVDDIFSLTDDHILSEEGLMDEATAPERHIHDDEPDAVALPFSLRPLSFAPTAFESAPEDEPLDLTFLSEIRANRAAENPAPRAPAMPELGAADSAPMPAQDFDPPIAGAQEDNVLVLSDLDIAHETQVQHAAPSHTLRPRMFDPPQHAEIDELPDSSNALATEQALMNALEKLQRLSRTPLN